MDIQGAKWNMRCVIYDCDGVLFDSLEANSRLYNDLCALGGRAPLRKEEIGFVHTHTVYEALRFIFKDKGLEKEALELLKQVDFRDYIVHLKMEPHLLQTLGRLKENGILRVVNTNRTTSMPHVMDRFNLWPFFDMVVTALDVKNPKPHPESIEKILQTFGLKREEVVFIGDSELDQKAARSAGIKFIAYKNREIPSDAFIEDHLELFKFVGAALDTGKFILKTSDVIP